MKKQFQSLTEKGRWLLATLTLIFTLGIGQMWGATTTMPTSGTYNTATTKYEFSNSTTIVQGNVIWTASRSNSSLGADGLCARTTGIFIEVTSPAELAFTIHSSTNSSRTISGQLYSAEDELYYVWKNTTKSTQTLEGYVQAVNAKAASARTTEEAAIAAHTKLKTITGSKDANKKMLIGETAEATLVTAVGDALNHTCPTSGKTNTLKVVLPSAGKYLLYFNMSGGTVGIQDITVTPIYQLTWALDGGSITSAADAYTNAGYYAAGTALTAPTVEKAGSDFGGWSPAVAATMPAAATTYTATWTTAATYDATFADGGHGTAPEKSEGVTQVTLAEITGVSGWLHTGWKANVATKNGTTNVPASTLIENGETITLLENTTFTAQWEKLYTVTYNKAGGEGGDVPTQDALQNGETFDVAGQGTLTAPTAGYIFRGWSDGIASDPYEEGDDYTINSANVSFTAVWEAPVTYTVALDANGGTIASYDGWDKEGNVYSKTVTEGTEVSLLAFTKSGLQLMFFRDGDDNEYSSSVTLNSNLNLKAIWGKEKEVELYYWEGKEGGATERGGEAITVDKTGVATEGNADVNASVSTYYTIRVQGKSDYSNPYIKITTDKAIKTGDKVIFTGFINKNQEKDAALLMKAGDKVLFAETTSLPNIAYPVASPESPEEREYTITTTGVDATVLDLMRNSGHTGTNCFVTKLAITGTRMVEEMSPAATPSITAQPTGASYSWKDAVSAMTVTAIVADGGALHYQWYKKGETDTKVGTDAASYTPEVAGTYYVVVTNKKTGFEDASVTSSDAVVTITPRPSYTVTYYDGTTTIGNESVLEEASPAEYTAKQAKAVYGITGLYEFEGWYNNSDLATEHKIADIAALSITANTPIYGKWNRIEAEDVNLVEYAATIAGDASTEDEFNAFKTWFSGKGYVYTNLNALDNKSGNNGAYLGLKTKSDAAYIAFNVPANKRVTVKLGYMAQAAEMYINGTKDESQALTGGSTSSGNNYADWYYDVTEASTLKLKMTTGSTCVVKAITIGDIPTVNNDATLKSLKIAGTAVEGFAASTLNYYYELDYGFTSYPAVTYEKNDDNANVVYHDASDRSDDCSIVKVTAEDGVTVNQYIIHFFSAPKYGVELIKATHDGTAAGADKAGYWASDVTIDKFTQNGGKLGSADHYFGLTLGNEKTFKAGDLVVIKASNISSTVELFDKKTFSTDQADSLTYLNKGNFNTHSKMYTFTLTADADKLYLYRTKTANSQMNPTVDYIAVYRQMAPFIEEFKIGDAKGEFSEENNVKKIAVEVPYNVALTSLTPNIKAWANGGASVTPEGAQDFSNGAINYTVSGAYAEDATGDYAPVTYEVTVSNAAHYVAQIGETKYPTLDAAVAYANENADSEIVLLEDITRDERITLTADATINLNGYTFGKTNGGWLIFVKEGATLTINGTTANSAVYGGISLGAATNNNGSLVLNGGSYSCGENTACIHINGTCLNSNVTINGATITNAYDNAIQFNGKGTFTITDATITGATGIYIKSGEMTITNSTVTGTMAPANYSYYGNGANATGDGIVVDACNYPGGAPTVNIVSGTFSGTKSAIGNYNYQGTSEPAVGGITGGTFSTAVPAELCAPDYAPMSWVNNNVTYYGVHLAGVIRADATQDAVTEVYSRDLDNGVVIFSSESDGRLKTSDHIATSSDVVTCGGDKDGYNCNQSKFVLQFPVNVKEFTLYGANSTEREISTVYVNAEASKEIKISNVGKQLTGTYTHTKDNKCQSFTAVFDSENIIAANHYVLVTMSGTANIYRVVYTEAECTTPVINSIDATRMKVGEQATVSVDASAVGATYQWYRCDDILGANPHIIDGATAASYSFTKAAGDEYFKVVVGCNCSAATVEDVVKAEEWYEVIRTNVTGYTEWSWNGVYDNETAGPTINQAQKGLVLASYIDAPNFDKLEGNNSAYVYRKNQYPAFQGTQLKFTTEVPGMLIIDASYTDNGNTFSVNGYPMGTLPKNHAKDTIAVKAGDVTITSQGIRIWAMTFDPDFSNYALTDNKATGYDRPVTEGRYGTICLENGGVMVGATLYEVAYYGETSKKIFFDEVLNGEMEAGVPYIYLPNEGEDALNVFYTDNADVTPATEGVNGLIGYIGASEETSDALEVPVGSYILNNNQYREVVYAGSAKILSHRAYINLAAITPTEPALAPGRRRISMSVQQSEVATDIDNLFEGEQPVKVMINGQLFIIRGEKMFDATGRLVK